MHAQTSTLIKHLKSTIAAATEYAAAFEQSKQTLINAITTQFGPVNQSNAHGCIATVAHLLKVDNADEAVLAAQDDLLLHAALLSEAITELQKANSTTVQFLRPYSEFSASSFKKDLDSLGIAAILVLQKRGMELFLRLNCHYSGQIYDATEHVGVTIKRLLGTDE